MRVLTLASTFPSAAQPARGVFVRERVRRMAERTPLEVVAPVPWFPGNRWVRPERDAAPAVERQGALTVHHPRFLCPPRHGKCLDAALYALSIAPYLARLRRRFPFDVLDAHFVYPDGVAAVLLGRWLGCPVMITLRGSIARLRHYRLHRPQLRWALARASRVTAVSASLREIAAGLGRPPDRVRVIPNGVDTARFAPADRAAARRALGLPERATVLLTVGGIYEGKGQRLVVEHLPALAARHPDLLYLLVGSGRPGERYVDELVRAAERLGVASRLRLAGPRPHDEMPRWLNAADLFVLATVSEGWPNVLLEAQACGVPVVATRVGGVPEVVRDGIDGLLVPPGTPAAWPEAILAALERRWAREELVRHARTRDWDDTALEALEELERARKEAA